MAYRRKENKGDTPKLDMTPMIDVVFQLLIFFVVVIKQEDIFSKLSAARPMTLPRETLVITTTVIVDTQGFTFNGKPMSLSELDRQLGRVATFNKTETIVVKCTKDSQHGTLVQALDLCSKHGLSNVALFSM